jgi:hypothetical protein
VAFHFLLAMIESSWIFISVTFVTK